MEASSSKIRLLGQIADKLGRTEMLRIAHLWGKRFSTEFRRSRFVAWAVEELKITATEAEWMDLERVANILAADPRQLSDLDREILESMKLGEVLLTKEIAARLDCDVGKIAKRLMEREPLKQWGFIVKRPKGNGFYRRE